MRKRRILSIILIAALAVISYFVLPETVVIQLSAGSSGNSTPRSCLQY